ncbi:MAG TPA: DUF2961 domain-containing protein [Verrucomicrobiota bacterium]|nr:DUF2961 domain-containing protein [Verrucomicrobiota bacterium]
MRTLTTWAGAWLACSVGVWLTGQAGEAPFNGLEVHLGNLFRLSPAKTRSISPENFTGEQGKGGMSKDGPALHAARDLGQGWKVSPYVKIKAQSTFTMAEIEGPGAIQHIWLTPAPLDRTRWFILRFYWDGEEQPSIEVPMGDFFACGWARYCQINSLAVCVNPGSAFNCYWPMPFRKKARVTLENLDSSEMTLYYQIDYALGEVPADAAYLHAQFRRVDPVPYKQVCTILDGVQGRGHYVGTYLAWEVHSTGWWGEGEIKFFIDGDREFPTICGTGTEDYFCGSYNFDTKGPDGKSRYTEFSTPYTGMPQVIRPDGVYDAQQRFGLYRWHLADPIRFETDLKVTIQALGWMSGGRYQPLKDDIASVAFWYQTEPHRPFPPLPSKDELELK